MKVYSLFTEISTFFVVLLFFLAPPIFNTAEAGTTFFQEWQFPISQLVMAAFALLIFLLYHKLKKSKINILGFRILFTIGLLFASSLFLNFLALVLSSGKNIQAMNFSLPDTFPKWTFCVLNFLLAAFYEEVIYRFYFTDTLYSILTQINGKLEMKPVRIICEITGCIIFALAHRYLGIFAVINAAIAHFILRYAYKKSNSIIPGFIAHFAYNMISLILL